LGPKGLRSVQAKRKLANKSQAGRGRGSAKGGPLGRHLLKKTQKKKREVCRGPIETGNGHFRLPKKAKENTETWVWPWPEKGGKERREEGPANLPKGKGEGENDELNGSRATFTKSKKMWGTGRLPMRVKKADEKPTEY